MLKVTNLIFAILLLAGSWQMAGAQAPMGNYDYYNMRQIIVNSAMANQAKRRAADKSADGRHGRSAVDANSGARENRALENSSVNKRPSATKFRLAASTIVPEQLLATDASNSSEAMERQAFYEDCLRENEKVITRLSQWRYEKGVKDVADAMTTFISSVHFVQRDKQTTWHQLSNISDQISQTPNIKTNFAKMSDREKQQTYETFSILGEIIIRGYDEAKTIGDRKAIEQYRQKVGELSMSILGVPADCIQITDEGLTFLKSGEKHADDEGKTTTFDRSAEVTTAPEYAYKYKVSKPFVAGLLKKFDEETIRRGGKTNDCAWVNAVAFALVYEAYTNGQIKLNQTQFNWVLKIMEDDVLADSRFQASSNDRKQRYYEQLAIESMWMLNEYREEGATPKFKAAAKAKLQDIFSPRNFEEYTLTANGFVIK